MIKGGYDEERRLYYVAASRAAQYLYITSYRPSPFFQPEDENILMPDILRDVFDAKKQILVKNDNEEEDFLFDASHKKVPYIIPVHQLMTARSSKTGGRGAAYGVKIHEFAAKAANSVKVLPENEDEKNILSFLKNIKGEKKIEVDCVLPHNVQGHNLVIRGVIDILVDKGDEVEVIDYKTDANRDNFNEYEKQVSVYCHAVKSVYPEKQVRGFIYYTYENQKVEVKTKDLEEIIDPLKEDFGF